MKSYCVVFILFIQILRSTASYKTAYVEDLCGNNNEGVWNLGSENSNSSGILKSSISKPFLQGMNCTVIIQPPLGFGVVLSVRHLDFRPFYLPHCQSYIEIFENDKTTKLCGYSDDVSEYQSYFSEGKALELHFHTVNNSGIEHHSEIAFIVTSFLKLPFHCDMKMFQCGNSRCIWKGLKCDGHNNCGDQSDESSRKANCGVLTPGEITGIVVGCVVGFLLLILLPFALCRCCRYKQTDNGPSAREPALIQPAPTYGTGRESNIHSIQPPPPLEPSTSYRTYQDSPPAYKP
ncbi:uncharacterized protein LOC129958399 [Argiope bruennichi]|uniref:CUB domain-containing protein n=1 Tax=Argiope bruennichi TaxID=94029 RepID=A0A8T0F2M6_ARGBR|nr:uncharacterized protein LOC129958399 [Argiope bruennichi]KAF8785387.1 hypothetical protein HNY73_010932 [Argiope bruennichi]